MTSMPTFPSIDLSKLDLSKFDLGKLRLPESFGALDTDKVLGVVRDAAYVVIGFGVLTVQQAQVRRRELATSLAANPVVKQLGMTPTQIQDLISSVEARVGSLDARLDAAEVRLDEVVERVSAKLPTPAATVLGQVHTVARTARKQVRGLVRSAA
jgi:hypothetical protein